jgi:L-rhamnose-H+ transport protein
MHFDLWAGAAIVFAAGVLQGSFALPMKYAHRWNHENIWLVFAFTGLVASPWLLTMATVPHLGQVYSSSSVGAVSAVVGFGTLWGIGATLTGLGLSRLGIGLGLSILIGLSATVGSLVPILVLTPEMLKTHQGHIFLFGSAVMLLGIAVAARAGALRDAGTRNAAEDSSLRGSFKIGLLLCIFSGLLSGTLNFSYSFGAEVLQHARELGASAAWASNAIAAPATSGGFLANLLYCGYKLIRNRSTRLYWLSGTSRNWGFGATMGVLWFGGLALYGFGTSHLGVLGSNLGWSLLMGAIVLTSNASGYLAGEWVGVSKRTRLTLAAGLAVILLALCILAMAQTG